MDLQVRANGAPLTPELRDFIDRRCAKLDHLAIRVVDAQLELRTRHQRSGGEITTAQLTLQTGRHILRAEEHDHDPAKAVDQAVDKLIRQMRRYHDKRTDRKGRKLGAEPVATVDGVEDVDVESDEDLGNDGVVRTKRFTVKPMMTDEAIDQMELLGHDFYLFLNADEDQLNVLYRRRDGAYGLLAPDRP